MSGHPRATPIGRVWTRILEIVAKSSLITTEGVAVALRPLAPGQLWPSRRDYGYALNMLTRMAKRGIVRRARPWMPGELWALTDEARELHETVKLIQRPVRRRYRTSENKRAVNKKRRDTLRARGLCISGEEHGKATRGCRCDTCHQVHKRSS